MKFERKPWDKGLKQSPDLNVQTASQGNIRESWFGVIFVNFSKTFFSEASVISFLRVAFRNQSIIYDGTFS